ncbi:MAG: hypothetical protein KIT14_01945 [bacterium]|nr:hypothetical protein [bacterium]
MVVPLLALVLLLADSRPSEAQKRPARCQGGYWVIDGDPLVPGGVAPDVLMLDRGDVSIASGCAPARPKTWKGGAKGDTLVVKWPACGPMAKATLKAKIAADCGALSGTFKVKGAKARKLTAQDGVPAGLREAWPDGLPDGAVIVSPREFLDISTQPGFRVLTPNQGADDDAAAEAIDAANRATIAQFLAENPEREDFVSTAVDPNDPTLLSSGDGNYLLTIWDDDGIGRYVVTQGPAFQRSVIADTIRTFPTQENQLGVYRQLWDFAHEHLDPTLPSPDDVVGESAEELSQRNRDITDQIDAAEAAAPLPGEILPASFPSRCSNEVGSGDGTDGSAYCQHKSSGLWRTATWPLKYYATCTKDQGGRGSCVAFATTAGREIRVAQRYERWFNLSEQHLYYVAKRTLQPKEYGDGLRSSEIQGQLLSSGYQQPLEQDWDYNPSRSRVEDDANKKYTDSCVDYGGGEAAFCSDTAHQGRVVCTYQGANLVCAVSAPPVGRTTVRTIEQQAELWDAKDPINGLRNVMIALMNQQPVIIGLETTNSFDTPDANGFVRFRPNRPKLCREVAIDPKVPSVTGCEQTIDCECPKGGHAVLAVGYIPEAKLPVGTPESTGGFLIIKNSWGCAGDGGYWYLPASWVRAFVKSARPVGDVEVVGPLPEQPRDNFTFDFTPAPPSIEIIQPTFGEAFVAGQGIPMTIEGADFQNVGWALTGPVQWTSSIQGNVGTGQSTVTTLVQGRHRLTASYTGTRGVTVSTSTIVDVGPAPPDLPPTAFFTSYASRSPAQCPGPCGSGADTCIVGFGYGSDPEDGLLTSSSRVRWYLQRGSGTRVLGSTGASSGSVGKFIGCFRACGTTFRFILEVEDSNGSKAEARRELATFGCVN